MLYSLAYLSVLARDKSTACFKTQYTFLLALQLQKFLMLNPPSVTPKIFSTDISKRYPNASMHRCMIRRINPFHWRITPRQQRSIWRMHIAEKGSLARFILEGILCENTLTVSQFNLAIQLHEG
jgi:hypothetical protein